MDAAAAETFCEKEAIFVSIYCPEQNFVSVLEFLARKYTQFESIVLD